MNLNINPIGVIKKSGRLDNILIYSDFDHITKIVVGDIKHGIDLLVVHKNYREKNNHQVCISIATLVERVGNLLTVKGINCADGDSVIDLRRVDDLYS